MHHNIQFLFSAISLSGLRQYLVDRGWQARSVEGSERVYFHRTFAGGEKDATLWSWPSEHKRFRHQVPNVIFALSVLEDRPALDIANEMFTAGEASTAASKAPPTAEKGAVAPVAAAPSPPPSLRRVLLRFAEAAEVTVVDDMLADTTRAAAGEALELVYGAGGEAPLELELHGGRVKAMSPHTAGLRLLQGVARPSVGPHWSAQQIVCEESRVLEDAGRSTDAGRLLEELGPTLARIDFEMDVNGPPDERRQAQLLRQTAILATALVRRLSDGPLSRRLVWSTCAKLLFPSGLRLYLTSTSVDELFGTAAADDELRPTATLTWLRDNTRSVLA